MPWYARFMNDRRLMEENKEQGGGGGGPDLASLQKQNADLLARLDALEKKYQAPKPDPKDEGDLADKARKERELKEKSQQTTQHLETAIKFNMSGPQWLKDNASLLPQSVEGIFVAAEKENYGSATEKAAAIKVGIFSEFFAREENMNHLTGPQKIQVEEFKKLTKTDKQDRVNQIWDNIFEPTFEMVKKVKRAAEMANGQKSQTDGEKALADRLMKLSKKHYLGDKDA